jgi:hypothetical protein
MSSSDKNRKSWMDEWDEMDAVTQESLKNMGIAFGIFGILLVVGFGALKYVGVE